jgi:hypothetical protein
MNLNFFEEPSASHGLILYVINIKSLFHCFLCRIAEQCYLNNDILAQERCVWDLGTQQTQES